jgi:hypothetical protein
MAYGMSPAKGRGAYFGGEAAMPCESTSVTLWYDLQGHPTGKFKFNCDGGCEGALKCKPVENGHIFFCDCVAVREDGSYDPRTRQPPPNNHSPCEGHITVTLRAGKEGDRTIVLLTPECPGHCDGQPGTHCKLDEKEDTDIVWEKDGSTSIVPTKTFKCKCK